MWDRNVEQVLEKLNSSEAGLSQKQAEQRLLLNGKMFVKKPQKRGISIFLNLACYCNILDDKKLKIMRKF